MPRISTEKLKKVDKRRLQLEEWKKQKQEAKMLLKKISKPPFKPVGKASKIDIDKNYNDPYLQKSTFRNTRLQSTIFNRTSRRITSTPFVKVNKKEIPKPFKKPSPVKRVSRRNTFDKENLTFVEHEKKSSSKNEKKSAVHFKENMTQIIPIKSPTYNEQHDSPISGNIGDEIRRTSHAGRTPFSCTESRSGSTPGRRDYPSSLAPNCSNNDTVNDLYFTQLDSKNNQATPKSASRKRRSNGKFIMKWSVPRGSIMERDPYLLRNRTPGRTPSLALPSLSKIEDNKSQTSTILNNLNTLKKKTCQVSFGDVLINTIEADESTDQSLTFDKTFDQLKQQLTNTYPSPAKCLDIKDQESLLLSPTYFNDQ